MYNFGPELLVLVENITIEAVGSEAFVKVRLLGCLSDVFQTEHASCVDHLIAYLSIHLSFIIRLNLHVVGSLVNLLKVTRNDLLDLLAIFKNFRVPVFRLPFDSSHHWMVPLDSQELVRQLVELFILHRAATG